MVGEKDWFAFRQVTLQQADCSTPVAVQLIRWPMVSITRIAARCIVGRRIATLGCWRDTCPVSRKIVSCVSSLLGTLSPKS